MHTENISHLLDELAYNVLFEYLFIYVMAFFSSSGIELLGVALLYFYSLHNTPKYIFCKNKRGFLCMYLNQACLERDDIWIPFYVLKFYRNRRCFI